MLRKTWIRGVLTLGLLGAVAAAMVVSPVGAAAPVTKAKVKKIANKVVDAENAIVSRSFAGGDVPGTMGFTYGPSTVIGSLNVPAGNWVFHADFEIARVSTGIIVGCRMLAGGTTDAATTWVGGSQTQTSVSLQRTAAYPSGGTVEVRCDDGTAPTTEANFSGLEIIAMEGSTLTAT
jgi:hypothetical protein